MTLGPNRPTYDGRELGRHLVRLIQDGLEKLRNDGEEDERCSSCAFRSGTLPNGCPETLMDALKCALESKPFYCHMVKPTPIKTCFGWYAARVSLGGTTRECPWPYSTADEAAPACEPKASR